MDEVTHTILEQPNGGFGGLGSGFVGGISGLQQRIILNSHHKSLVLTSGIEQTYIQHLSPIAV